MSNTRLGHHERQVAEHARLVQDPDHKYLALAVGNPGRIQGKAGLVLIARPKLDEALSFATRSLDCLDIYDVR